MGEGKKMKSQKTAPLKNTPQVTVVSRGGRPQQNTISYPTRPPETVQERFQPRAVVSRSGGVDPNKTRFPLQPDPRRGSKRTLNQVQQVLNLFQSTHFFFLHG